jgi:hypothetical protein
VLIDPLPEKAIAALARCKQTVVPRDAQRGLILAAGEATGHHHRTVATTAELYRLDEIDAEFARIMARSGVTVAPGDQVLRVVAAPAEVVHEEHAAHTLMPGVYLVTIAEEYVAPAVTRRVQD